MSSKRYQSALLSAKRETSRPQEHAAQNHHDQPSGIMRPVWLHLALLKQCDLFAQEEFLGCQCAARPGNEHEEAHETGRDGRQRGEAVCQQWKTEPGMNVAL